MKFVITLSQYFCTGRWNSCVGYIYHCIQYWWHLTFKIWYLYVEPWWRLCVWWSLLHERWRLIKRRRLLIVNIYHTHLLLHFCNLILECTIFFSYIVLMILHDITIVYGCIDEGINFFLNVRCCCMI